MTQQASLNGIEPATAGDVGALVELHNAVAEALTVAHGKGHRSRSHSDRSLERALAQSHVFVRRRSGQVEGTLCLTKRKPWAIDPAYFTPAARPLYLLDMAVRPDRQRLGIGKALLEFAFAFASQGSFDAVRLDAYDSPAGAARPRTSIRAVLAKSLGGPVVCGRGSLPENDDLL